MSQAMKALANITIIPKYHNYSLLRHLCYGKDLTKSPSVGQSSSPDYLMHNLKNAHNLDNVLQIVHEHHNIMNAKHLVQALQSIFDLQKSGQSYLTPTDIVRHPDFEKLCRKLNTQFGTLDPSEAINALKTVSYLKVPSHSKIVQVLLQILRENINQLSLRHLVFLNFLLEGFKSSPLVDALKIAIPIVFDIQFSTKVDRRNITQLTEFLYFATNCNGVSNGTIEELLSILMGYEDRFSSKTAKDIVWAICGMVPNEVFAPLLNRSLDDLIVNIYELDFDEVEITLSKLVAKYNKKHSYYYNEVFCEACANFVIDKDCGFKEALYISRKLGRVRHHNRYLLDYIARNAHEDPSVLQTMYSVDVYGLAVQACLTDYRPPHWEVLSDHIKTMKNLAAEDKKEVIWIRYAAALCLLDIYKIDVLNKALSPVYLDKLLKKLNFSSDFENYFAIWQCLKFRRTELFELIPEGYEPENIIQYMKDYDGQTLEAALAKGIGGQDFIRTKMFSRNGIKIDHAILFRKGGYPIQIDGQINFIEDIPVQPDQQLILVLALDEVRYTINTKVPRLSTVQNIKILEDSGHNVVPISVENWEALNDFEKIPYLMQAIRNKLNTEFRISEHVV